jgi:hypothetical protein
MRALGLSLEPPPPADLDSVPLERLLPVRTPRAAGTLGRPPSHQVTRPGGTQHCLHPSRHVEKRVAWLGWGAGCSLRPHTLASNLPTRRGLPVPPPPPSPRRPPRRWAAPSLCPASWMAWVRRRRAATLTPGSCWRRSAARRRRQEGWWWRSRRVRGGGGGWAAWLGMLYLNMLCATCPGWGRQRSCGGARCAAGVAQLMCRVPVQGPSVLHLHPPRSSLARPKVQAAPGGRQHPSPPSAAAGA